MNSMQTTDSWSRRLPQVALAVAFIIIVFYALHYFVQTDSFSPMLSIGLLPALLAGAAALSAGATFLKLPKKIGRFLLPLTQILLLAAVAVTIYTTGGIDSHFTPLWMAAVIFVGVFGTKSLFAAALIPVGYAAWLAVTSILTLPTSITLFLIGMLPLFLSYMLFKDQSKEARENPYTQLANQLSQISGKSEVVIHAITNGVLALDKQGIVELINPAAERLIGWEKRDALKLDYKSVLQLLDAEGNELTPATDPILKALSTNEEVRTEDLNIVTSSGKKFLISLVASPVGQPGSGIIIVFRDITKEKAEEREQAEFISTASHEMRTPVASIEGYLGLALNPATAQIDDKARSYITKAHEVAQHLGRLFQDLLDITKAEDGRLSNNPRAVEVVAFVQDVVEGLRPQAEAKGLVLLYKPIPDDGHDEKSNRRLNPVFYANVDNDHLREVVGNLVENAVKYTKQGTISVDVGGDDKQIEISVQDTGIGIPTEDLSHLFQKFYRVDNSDTREIGGTGLGLYLSRRLVETMEGRLWAESQYGQGSTFFMSIPRISHQEAMQLIETLQDEPATPPIGPAISNQPIPPVDTAPSFAPPVNTPPSMPITQPTVNPSTEGVFANLPANDIANQLAAQPSPMTAPPAPQPTYQAPPVQNQNGTGPSLAAIEQNPAQYLQQQSPPPAAPSYPPATQESPSFPPQSQNQP